MEKYFKQYDKCRQDEKPYCAGACPFHLNVMEFISRMENGKFNSAFKTLRDAFAFPAVVAELCEEQCAAECLRKDIDKSVQLNLLEKTCIAKATKKEPQKYNLPARNKKVGIIGAGGSGLTCALRLAQKKYEVIIWEKSDKLGGILLELLPASLCLEEFKEQFKYETYQLHYNTEIQSLETLQEFGVDAVYIATGENGLHFGALNNKEKTCFVDGNMGIFSGGRLLGKNPVEAIAQGMEMAKNIENYLKTGVIDFNDNNIQCRGCTDTFFETEKKPVLPSDNGLFTEEEAVREANRCLKCRCDGCMNYCDVNRYYKKQPRRLRDDIMATVAFSTSPSFIKKTPARRLINTCTQCGICEEICPEGIETGTMLLEARRSLHRQGTLPGAYHQFWMRDMEFANSDRAAVSRCALGYDSCTYTFFPGCQLGAAQPRYVLEAYEWLLKNEPSTGMILNCCGLPAEWAGDEASHQNVISNIREEWKRLGKPVLITACASCRKHLQKYLPEIETVMLYSIMEEINCISVKGKNVYKNEVFNVFDPCSVRNQIKIQKDVRNLALRAGLQIEEFPRKDFHGCCGYGGHVSEANPEYYDYVVSSRCDMSMKPYLVYCINCRDIFRERGKRAIHILELFFPSDTNDEALCDLSKRRQNRIELKNKLLQRIWKEENKTGMDYKYTYHLLIKPAVRNKMENFKMLEEDVYNVIEAGELSERCVYDPKKDSYICYQESGYFTFWVEYRKISEGYEVLNVYSHRMKIKLESVWNGRKTNFDV